jgi:hypothetical protein
MKLQDNEQIVKVFHHHPTARLFRSLGILFACLPFFFVAWFFRDVLSPVQMVTLYIILGLFTFLVLLYDSILYYLDRLIITNQRILYVDWNGAFSNTEHEAELVDIQDIETIEKGFFAIFPIFDFGDFTLETASTHTTIRFPNAPDPEGIKHFIYHLNIKPHTIRGDGLNTIDDTTRKTTEDAASVARRQ